MVTAINSQLAGHQKKKHYMGKNVNTLVNRIWFLILHGDTIKRHHKKDKKNNKKCEIN